MTGSPGVAPVRRVVLGVGSNLGDRRRHLRDAVAGWGAEVTAVSDVYETDPVGGPDQGRFLNLVLVVETDLSAHEVLARAQALEADARRVRAERWGPRTLDVDVLWIDGERHDDATLTVPHPRMHEREFVTAPLAEVAPDLVPPGGGPTGQGVRRVGALGSTGAPSDGEDGGRGPG